MQSIVKVCPTCQENFETLTRKQKYCSKYCCDKAANRRNAHNRVKQNRRIRQQRKQECVDYKGGKCQRCGYDRCLGALDFHHLEGKDKGISELINEHRPFETMKSELDKCILLCCRCHREEHFKEIG